MKTYTYHTEIRTLIRHFIAAFDDITIKRYDGKLNVIDEIRPTFKYAPKRATLYDIVQNTATLKLPVVSVAIESFARDTSRVHNKHSGIVAAVDNRSVMVNQPVPVDLSISMAMIARYQMDIEQMITNWAAYTDPDIFISYQHPITQQELTAQIIWNGNVSLNYPLDITADKAQRIEADTSFTVKGWIFKGNNQSQPGGGMKRINLSLSPVSEFPCTNDYGVFQSDDVSDYFTIHSCPFPRKPSCPSIPTDRWTDMTIYGQQFQHTTSVYLSAGDGVTFHPSVSANVGDWWPLRPPGIGPACCPQEEEEYKQYLQSLDRTMCVEACSAIENGYRVPDWTIGNADPTQLGVVDQTYTTQLPNGDNTSWNSISFDIPPLIGEGFVDVLVYNPSGCGSLARDSVCCQYDIDDEQWKPADKQPPWACFGIRVVGPPPYVEPEPGTSNNMEMEPCLPCEPGSSEPGTSPDINSCVVNCGPGSIIETVPEGTFNEQSTNVYTVSPTYSELGISVEGDCGEITARIVPESHAFTHHTQVLPFMIEVFNDGNPVGNCLAYYTVIQEGGES